MTTMSVMTKECYLPVLQSSETIKEKQKRLKRLNVPKISPSNMIKTMGTEKHDYKVKTGGKANSVLAKTDFNLSKKLIISDIDIISVHIRKHEIKTQKLKGANSVLEKENKALKQKLLEYEQNGVSFKEDKQKDQIKRENFEVSNGETLGKGKQYEMLVATITDKDAKLTKLTEVIALLRNKLKEREGELTRMKSDKESLMEVNEEMVQEITSLNQRHSTVVSNKDRQIASLQEEYSFLRNQSSTKAAMTMTASEKKKLEDLQRDIEARTLALEDETFSLRKERKIIEDSKKLIDEENQVILDEKRVIDEEWGDIVRKKKEIQDTENEIEEKVKDLMEESKKVSSQNAVLESELGNALDELAKLRSESGPSSEDTVNDIIQVNSKVVESLQTELQDKNSRLENIQSIHEERERKMKEEILLKEGMIEDLEYNVEYQAARLEEQSKLIENQQKEYSNNKLEIARLKLRLEAAGRKRKTSVDDGIEKRKKSKTSHSTLNSEEEHAFQDTLVSQSPSMIEESMNEVTRGEEVRLLEQEQTVDEEIIGNILLIDENDSTETRGVDEKEMLSDGESVESIAAFLVGNGVPPVTKAAPVLITQVADTTEDVNEEDATAGIVRVSNTIDPLAESYDTETSGNETVTSTVVIDIDNRTMGDYTIEMDVNEAVTTTADEENVDQATVNDRESGSGNIFHDESAQKLIAAMTEFESLIESSKIKDTAVLQGTSPSEPVSNKSNVPKCDSGNNVLNQVDDVIGQMIKIDSSKKKSKSIRDVFDDTSDDETEETPCMETETEKVQIEGPTRPTLKVKNITAISRTDEDFVDKDVIIPTECSPDLSLEIIEVDETVKSQAHIDSVKLQSQVARLVKLSLDKFYQLEDGIQTQDDLLKLTDAFSKKFTEEITADYLEKNPSTAGVEVTEDHKKSLVDQMIFFFETKKSVNMNLKKHMNPGIPKFSFLSSELTNQFSKELVETHRAMYNSLAGLSFTSDSHHWIGDIIARQLNVSMK